MGRRVVGFHTYSLHVRHILVHAMKHGLEVIRRVRVSFIHVTRTYVHAFKLGSEVGRRVRVSYILVTRTYVTCF